MAINRRRSMRTSLWRRNSSKASSSISQQLDSTTPTLSNHDTKSPASISTLSRTESTASEIPIILEKCKNEIISRGISAEGIFRRSGPVAMIDKLMKEFRMVDDPRIIDLSGVYIHTVAGLFKRYLQQLSEPVIPKSFQPELLDAYESAPNVYQKRNRLIGVCQALPQKHYELLSFVLHAAHTISRHSDQNKMSAENLAIIFAPTCIQLDGLSHLLPDNTSTESTSNNSNSSSNSSNNKSPLKPSRIKSRLLRTVSMKLNPNRFSSITSTTSSFASLGSREQGLSNFCRSILTRTRQSTSEEEKSEGSCSIPHYESEKLLELNLVKENMRWNKLFEFMINHPPLSKFDGQSKQLLSPVLSTVTVSAAGTTLSQIGSPASVYYDALEDNEIGAHIMLEVIDETMAALSDETAEFFGSILKNNLDARYQSPRTPATNSGEDAYSRYAAAWKHWREKEIQPMPQLWKRNSVTHHHRQTHGNGWMKSLSQSMDCVVPAKKRPLSISFIPRTRSRLSAFLR